MKKCLFVTLSFLILASCSVKTNEEKAREIIEPEVKSSLIIPESYEFAQLQAQLQISVAYFCSIGLYFLV